MGVILLSEGFVGELVRLDVERLGLDSDRFVLVVNRGVIRMSYLRVWLVY